MLRSEQSVENGDNAEELGRSVVWETPVSPCRHNRPARFFRSDIEQCSFRISRGKLTTHSRCAG